VKKCVLLQLFTEKKLVQEHVSTHNVGVNGKIRFALLNFTTQIHLHEHIPSVTWGNTIIFNAVLDILECLTGIQHKKHHYLIQLFSCDNHQLTPSKQFSTKVQNYCYGKFKV
jgi:hypothetical protein